MRGRPFFHGACILSEHPLAGAGRIHERHVEPGRKRLRHGLRLRAGHSGIRHAEALQRGGKRPRPVRHDLVGKQESFPCKPRRRTAAFPARGSAEIQHPHARLHARRSNRRHRGRLLQIEQACQVVRMVPDARHILIQKEPLRQDPRFRQRERADAQEFLRADLQRVHTKAALWRHCIACEELRVFLPQLRLHALQKFGWQILSFHKDSITPLPAFGERRFG